MGLHLAFITGALWTKRGERGVSRKIPLSPPLAHKVPVMRARLRHDSSLVWQFFNDRGEFPWEHVASPLYFPPLPFPYQRLHYSGVSFQAWQFKFIPTFRHTRCRNQHYYLSNSHYSAILCLVWDLLHSHRTGSRKYPLLCNISFTLANKKWTHQ